MLRLRSNAASGYAMRYPALGPKKTPNPPLPPERRGAPHATISKKSNWLKNAAFGFRMLPDKSTPIVWSVIGTGVKDKKSGGRRPQKSHNGGKHGNMHHFCQFHYVFLQLIKICLYNKASLYICQLYYISS